MNWFARQIQHSQSKYQLNEVVTLFFSIIGYNGKKAHFRIEGFLISCGDTVMKFRTDCSSPWSLFYTTTTNNQPSLFGSVSFLLNFLGTKYLQPKEFMIIMSKCIPTFEEEIKNMLKTD